MKRKQMEKLRNQGKQYISKTGKTIAKKSVKTKECSKCSFKCSLKVSEEEAHTVNNTILGFRGLRTTEKFPLFKCIGIGYQASLKGNP